MCVCRRLKRERLYTHLKRVRNTLLEFFALLNREIKEGLTPERERKRERERERERDGHMY